MLNKKERAEHEQMLARIKELEDINKDYQVKTAELLAKYHKLQDMLQKIKNGTNNDDELQALRDENSKLKAAVKDKAVKLVQADNEIAGYRLALRKIKDKPLRKESTGRPLKYDYAVRQQVLQLINNGTTIREIAKQLKMSPTTVIKLKQG